MRNLFFFFLFFWRLCDGSPREHHASLAGWAATGWPPFSIREVPHHAKGPARVGNNQWMSFHPSAERWEGQAAAERAGCFGRNKPCRAGSALPSTTTVHAVVRVHTYSTVDTLEPTQTSDSSPLWERERETAGTRRDVSGVSGEERSATFAPQGLIGSGLTHCSHSHLTFVTHERAPRPCRWLSLPVPGRSCRRQEHVWARLRFGTGGCIAVSFPFRALLRGSVCELPQTLPPILVVCQKGWRGSKQLDICKPYRQFKDKMMPPLLRGRRYQDSPVKLISRHKNTVLLMSRYKKKGELCKCTICRHSENQTSKRG